MPQLRSFSGFAGTPGIGSAYVGGLRTAADAQSDAARIQVERQKLAQASVEANMRAQAQAQELAQKAMMQSQELAVQQAYQKSMIGLKERELGTEQQKLDMQAQEAAQQFQARQSMQQEVEKAIAGGSNPSDAFLGAAVRYGPGAGLPGTAYSDIIQNAPSGGGAQMGPAAVLPVEGTDEYKYFQTGPNSRTLVPRKADLPPSVRDIPGAEGYQQIGKSVVRKIEPQQEKDLRTDKKRLETWLDSDKALMGQMALRQSQDPKSNKLSRVSELALQEYLDKQKELEKIKAALAGGGGGSTTNRVGRFKVIHQGD